MPGDGRSGSGGIGGAFDGRSGAGALDLLNNLFSCTDEAGGVLGSSVHPHFIVQVDAGGASGGAHGADPLAQRDALARLDGHGVQVGEAGLETATMVYLNGVAIP
jgi:hypothetical protein